MSADPSHLAAALEAALAALEQHGVTRDRVVLGITDPHDAQADGTDYEAHVGPTDDRSTATLLSLVAEDLAEGARMQGVALAGKEPCPECGSPRYGPRRARRERHADEPPGVYVAFWKQCMACGYRNDRP